MNLVIGSFRLILSLLNSRASAVTSLVALAIRILVLKRV
jgi:hypothetical protein